MELIQLLGTFELFKDLSEEKLKLVAAKAVKLDFAENQEIFHELSTESDIYILMQGRVQIVGALGKTDSATIHTILPGKLFGEFAFIDGEPRSATALAIEKTTVFKIPRADLYALFEGDQAMGYIVMRNLARILARRIRQTAHELRSSLMWERH
ncbi:MAG: cyclic nucleotide-binding domain-containing protein [Spirochaetes bacterium]|nr:cyclic nucleotide-binding domain-containing protein [Spirochaetota bacterium]MBX3722867.1 cyclic nucleotide-binding domain-containing protein [Turneriella sp.]